MFTLIIASHQLRQWADRQAEIPGDLVWVHDLREAFSAIENTDIDTIVFDLRSPPFNSPEDLKRLLAGVDVTTRVLAIVDQLPEEHFFSESGVVYLTPPVNLTDVLWFIRQAENRVQSG